MIYLLITKEVEVTITNNAKYYEDLYIIPKWIDKQNKEKVKRGTKILVKVEDLPSRSNVFIDVECDGCGKELNNIKWSNYQRSIKEDGKYYCQKCAHSGNKKWMSFYEWCYLNLPKEDADNILLRWDYELNIDKDGQTISPSDIVYSSEGLNRYGYWFKCLDHPEHKSEQKRIVKFTFGFKGSITCNQCNSISITRPDLAVFLVNKNDMYKYSVGSNEDISMKCPDCGYEKEMRIPTLIKYGFGCNRCGDHFPYGEKFFANFLEQLVGNDFKIQLNKKNFKWCDKYKYDFYINKINGICEVGGLQHYKENTNWEMSLKEVQDNDKCKEKLAKDNGIDNYIVLDCRISALEFIKNSIMQSNLPKLLCFKEDDIDWLKCHEAGCSNLVKSVCTLWVNGIKNVRAIADELKINRTTVARYLKRGATLDWCDLGV